MTTPFNKEKSKLIVWIPEEQLKEWVLKNIVPKYLVTIDYYCIICWLLHFTVTMLPCILITRKIPKTEATN